MTAEIRHLRPLRIGKSTAMRHLAGRLYSPGVEALLVHRRQRIGMRDDTHRVLTPHPFSIRFI